MTSLYRSYLIGFLSWFCLVISVILFQHHIKYDFVSLASLLFLFVGIRVVRYILFSIQYGKLKETKVVIEVVNQTTHNTMVIIKSTIIQTIIY